MSRHLNEKERTAFMEAIFSDPVVVFKNNFSRHSYIFIFSYIFFNVFLMLLAGTSTIFGPTIFLPTDSIYPTELKQSTLKIQTFIEFCTIFMFNLTFTFRKGFFLVVAFALMFFIQCIINCIIIWNYSDQLLYVGIGMFQIFFMIRILLIIAVLIILLELKFTRIFR
jgi:hypothetical protein